MSEGVETSQAPVSQDAEPSLRAEAVAETTATGPDSELAPHPQTASQADSAPGLAPPPIPSLTQAQKANLLPPPPRVKSRYAAAQSAIEQAVDPGAQRQVHQESEAPIAGEPLVADQSAEDRAEEGAEQTSAPQELLAQEGQEAQALLENTLAPQVEFPADVSEHLPEQLEEAEPATSKKARRGSRRRRGPVPASHPNDDALIPGAPRHRPAFQSALDSQAASESSNRTKIIFAVVGLLVLAALCWWQLGGA